MNDILEKLEELERVDGFIAAGIIDTEGSLIGEFSTVKDVRWKQICDVTGEVMKNTRKLADLTGIGKTRFVHITLPEGNILARCLEKRTNGSASKIDRIVIFLGPEGNTGLGKLKLDSLVNEVAGN